jgi:hypothetical protein
MWRETSPSFQGGPGPLGTFTPGENVTATPKAARGISLMEPSSLNPVTPSAGSSTSASASAVPFLRVVKLCALFVGNYVARVGHFGWWVRNYLPNPVILNLIQNPSRSKTRARKNKWTLKQVQGDEVRMLRGLLRACCATDPRAKGTQRTNKFRMTSYFFKAIGPSCLTTQYQLIPMFRRSLIA